MLQLKFCQQGFLALACHGKDLVNVMKRCEEERMRRLIVVSFVVFTVLFVQGGFGAEATSDPLDLALARVGLTRGTMNFGTSTTRNIGEEKFSLGVFRQFLNDPLKVPYLLGHFKKNYLEHKDSLHDTLMYMTSRVGEGVSRGYEDTEPLKEILERLKEKDALAKAFAAVFAACGKTFTASDKDALEKEIEKIPEEIRKDIALLLYTSASALEWHSLAFRDVREKITPPLREAANYLVLRKDTDARIKYDLEKLIEEVDYRFLFTGMLDIAEAIDKASANLRKFKPQKDFAFRYSTPLGQVVISAAGNDVYDGREGYLLIVDFRGNDVYTSGVAAGTLERPISIVMDFQGNDTYKSVEENTPSAGAGVFGYGFLLDYEGDDTYLGVDMTQGCGIFGVGALVDYAGNDTYAARSTAQASAQFGLGLLVDYAGDDRYYSLTASQAYAGPKGHALFVDFKGNDRYVLDDTHVVFPSPQTKEHNKSEGQGFGSGVRSDMFEGHSFAGGFAVLWDIEGDDAYSAGVFAQGGGFWDAAGVLIDSQGDDSYLGIWYVQGAGVHTGVGALLDEGGNDRYRAKANAAQGIGHDFSVGMLIDRKGNDTYDAPSLALGVGNDNGIGMFLDIEGDDVYRTKEPTTFGFYRNTKLGTLREDRLSLGLFLDLRGADDYPKKSRARNDSIWVQKREHPEFVLPCERGVGLDGDYPLLRLDFEPKTK
jgi:hypothetical protein